MYNKKTNMLRNISDAKTELSALLEEVQKGGEVIIAKAGKPIAKLVPFSGVSKPRIPGVMAGKIWMAPDFNEFPSDPADAFMPLKSKPKEAGD
jgi:prevent-host-death family protein